MPADKCYCRPNRDPLPRWPCENASTAFKLCCLSATIYDVRCWGVQGDRDRYVEYSPGDIIGQKGTRTGSQYTINCDPDDPYQNTNLRGNVAFMFPDADVNPDGFDPQDAVNPWLPCPCIQTELQDGGLYYTTLKTWVGVSWSYSCDTGLVSFRAVWGGWAGNDIYPWQEYYLLVNQLAGKEAVVTADPDWYLDNEITIPYATENDTNRLSRFSVKLRMTCEGQETCHPYLCYPKCVANTCDGDSETVNASAVFITADDGATEHEGTATWSDVSSEYTFSFDVGVLCGTLSGRIYCDGEDIKVDFDLFDGVTHTYATFTVDWTCVDGDVSWTTPTAVSGITCALDITLWTNNVS